MLSQSGGPITHGYYSFKLTSINDRKIVSLVLPGLYVTELQTTLDAPTLDADDLTAESLHNEL